MFPAFDVALQNFQAVQLCRVCTCDCRSVCKLLLGDGLGCACGIKVRFGFDSLVFDEE